MVSVHYSSINSERCYDWQEENRNVMVVWIVAREPCQNPGILESAKKTQLKYLLASRIS